MLELREAPRGRVLGAPLRGGGGGGGGTLKILCQ